MTVEDLRDELDRMVEDGHGNKEVYAACDYGDYSHTMQLVELGEAQLVTPAKTAYSNTGLALPRTTCDVYVGDDDDEVDDVIVLGDDGDCW